MSDPDSNPGDRLLLAASGWGDPAWLSAYYPDDLPADWRLDYFANDFDCAVIDAADWRGRPGELATWLGSAPATLGLCLRVVGEADVALWPAIGGRRVTVLGTPSDAAGSWPAVDAGRWQSPRGDAAVVRLNMPTGDLRDLRQQIEGLAGDVRMLWLDGPGFEPASIGDIRTLLQLMGRH